MAAAAYGKCDFPPFDLAEEGADDGGHGSSLGWPPPWGGGEARHAGRARAPAGP